jgi:S-adenosylmethionine:tRNA ribosyltransferase-isomerase
VHRRGCLDVEVFESRETRIDTAPARAYEVDQQSQVVHARLALGEELAFDPLEPADRLVEEAADLRDVARNRKDLRTQAVAHRFADVGRDRRLQLGRRCGESLDLLAGSLERRFEVRRMEPAVRGCRNTLLCPFQRGVVHGGRGYSQRRMDTARLDYELPPDLIAQRPLERRDNARLLVYRRGSGDVQHRRVADLSDILDEELVVVNDTRVVPARLRLRRDTGGSVEVLLVERLEDDGVWEALVRPSRRMRPGEMLGPVELLEPIGDGRWTVRLEGVPQGEAPLPPYIHEPLDDPERYQTVYAREPGSAAAPTAGLHFTPELLRRLDHETVTLHVGLDTFRPVTSDRLEDHELHGERYHVCKAAWTRIRAAERVLAVGTTTVRVLETLARGAPLEGRTSLFITPGFGFKRVDSLLTNFHLPRSTLLALVMAFAGEEEIRGLYRIAVENRYRFYSFGDAMLVL